MSDWKLIVPAPIINLVDNSSFEINTAGWTFDGANTGTRDTNGAKFGLAACRLVYQDDLDLARHAITLTAAAHTFSVWVFLGLTWDGGAIRLAMENFAGSSITTATTTTTALDTWIRLQITVTPVGGDLVGDLVVEAASAPTAGRAIRIDAAQCELQTEPTTYCDGDQPGCEWLGLAHASTSQRSAQSRAGGFIRDFKTDFGFGVANFMNTGMPTQSTEIDNYALLPGGQLNDIKIEPREFTLMGTLSPTKIPDCTKSLDDVRAVLEKELAHDRYPEGPDGWQPILIRYTGDDVQKEIAVHYSGGLEGRIAVNNQIQENVPLRFTAPDPNWYEIGQSAQLLDTEDGPTLRYVAARLKSTGQWDDLGLTANPTAGGDIHAVLEASDKTVYYGGFFTGFDGNAGWDYLVKYIPSTDTWARLDGASEFNDLVLALAEAPDGTIYVGGVFTNAGDANGDYLAKYTPSTDTVASVSGGGTGQVETLAFDNNGLLIIGGNFVAWNGVNESECIVSWNGAAYAAMGNGFDTTVSSVAVAPDNTVYATGLFTTDWDASNPFVRFASWDGTAWTQVGNGLNGQGIDLVVTPSGIVTVGGLFTNQDGVAEADFILQWNGSAITAMGTGANGGVYALAIAPNGNIFASGAFTTIGGVTTRYGQWNGSSWASTDIVLPGAPTVRAAAFGSVDPVTLNNFDHWIGFDTTGAAAVAGSTIVTNEGTAHTFPEFIVERTGGTSAVLKSLRTETLGLELLYDYGLLDGERLTTINHPLSQNIVSSFFGQRLDATLAGDDFGDWSLQPGANQVTSFIDNDGASIEAFLLYRDAYKGHAD